MNGGDNTQERMGSQQGRFGPGVGRRFGYSTNQYHPQNLPGTRPNTQVDPKFSVTSPPGHPDPGLTVPPPKNPFGSLQPR